MLRLLGVASLLCSSPMFGQASRAATHRQCFARDFQREVRDAVRGYARVTNILGVSFGIVARGALVLADGVGFANVRRRVRADADTPYNIASVTKLFTATLAMQLAGDGRLDLDGPVSRYLPDSVRAPADTSGTPITVRHLLTHTAGLPRDPPNRRNQPVTGPIDPGVWDAYSVSDLYSALGRTTLSSKPGATMEYSNYGYALLGHVVERISGAPYERVLRERLLSPLGMRASGISVGSGRSRELAAFYWSDDDSRTEQLVHARFGDVAAFIGMTSTVRDLARFLIAHTDASRETRSVIAPTIVRQMAMPQVQLDSTNRLFRVDMALGWVREVSLGTPDATPLQWHFGEIDGHASAVFLRPLEGVGVVVLQNLGGETGATATEQLGRWLIRRAEGEVRRCRS